MTNYLVGTIRTSLTPSSARLMWAYSPTAVVLYRAAGMWWRLLCIRVTCPFLGMAGGRYLTPEVPAE
ncbi:hypothetical protein [Streptomyces arboris]|uniref:Uncharacterized protein n=1 Tax=Streptomyces arboris TaxID=2600619 RepID=A0A5N5EIH1_9ACTN|nr:hypothetical protein [Streptomyces arboris]KAB2588680.1 hypothetical protein F5983_30930 [Streptomyces arboris]